MADASGHHVGRARRDSRRSALGPATGSVPARSGFCNGDRRRSPDRPSLRARSPLYRASHQIRVARDIERPTLIAGDAVAQAFPAVPVTVEVTMLELDPRPLGRLHEEADLDLASAVEIRLELPVRGDIPGEHQAFRGLVHEDARPLTLAAVDATVVDASAGLRLENRLSNVYREHVVLAWLDVVELLDEHAEGAVLRRLDSDVRSDRGLVRLGGHSSSSVDSSTSCL